VGLMGDGDTGERTIATGDGMLSESEGRAEVTLVEMESESLGLTAREASIFVRLTGFISWW
jgi:hypothetical protein